MTAVTFRNYKEVMFNGARIVYDNHVTVAEKDSAWNGGYNVGGRSILNILEEFDLVEVL